MGTASFSGFKASAKLGGVTVSAKMGGGGGALNNDIKRAYAYPETLPVELPPNTVTNPQPFTMEYADADGVVWQLIKNTTTWIILEQGQ